MSKDTTQRGEVPEIPSELDQIVKVGAQRMLQAALETEVDEFMQRHEARRDAKGRRDVVRNGHLPERTVLTGAGPLSVTQPRVRDKAKQIQFSSKILPPYLRRTKKLNELIPWLYLKGISTGDFGEALQALLGPDAKNVSANVVVKLKEKWAKELESWRTRDLSQKEYVYLWADGVYFNVRLDEERQCILVVIGATREGEKELVAIQDGYRESEQSWAELLLDLKNRGLETDPKLAAGDGALGFWAALRKIYPETLEQRCWVHKTANILDKMPRSVQARAKADLHQIWMAPTRKLGHKAFDHFETKYEAKFSKAVECLRKDRDVLLTFYDFPAQHWIHLRTTNPVESTFATVRLRQRRTKGNGTRLASLVMVFKLVQAAEKRWRKLNEPELIKDVFSGRKFVDGILQDAA